MHAQTLHTAADSVHHVTVMLLQVHPPQHTTSSLHMGPHHMRPLPTQAMLPLAGLLFSQHSIDAEIQLTIQIEKISKIPQIELTCAHLSQQPKVPWQWDLCSPPSFSTHRAPIQINPGLISMQMGPAVA